MRRIAGLVLAATFPAAGWAQVRAGDWTLLGQDYQLTADTTVTRDGVVYFTDAQRDRILPGRPGRQDRSMEGG